MKLVTLIAVALALSAKIFAANDPFAENVRTTNPLAPEEQQKKFRVPPGFEVQLVAAEPQLRKPMNMQFDTVGRLWFTESREYPFPTNTASPRDTIRILSDFDANGRAQKVTTFATNLNIPIGLYPFQSPASDGSGKLTWKCVAWSIPNIWLFEDTDGDGVSDKKTFLYGPFDITRDTHGNQSSFRRGFDGWLYAHHGFNNDSHVTAKDGSHVDLNSGNSYRIRFDGSRIEHFTHGQVNPFGLAFDAFGNMYSSDCHSAPTYELLAGGYYPSFGKPHDGLGFAPVLMEHSHGSTAIDGMLYYTDDLWPAEFQNNTFLGNVMTSRINRDKLVFNGSSPRAIEQDDFVKSDDPWFRPVDNQLGPDGAFYIADFYNRIIGHYEVPLVHPGRDRERGRIWRVVYKGEDGKAKLRPLALANDLDGLIKEMSSPSLTRRMLAMNAIEDRFGKAAVSALQTALKNLANEFQQVHILWLLHRLDAITGQQLLAAWSSPDSILRVHAARIAADTWYRDSHSGLPMDITRISASHEIAMTGLKDPDPLVQRCAAEAAGKMNISSSQQISALLELREKIPAADTHLLYVVRKSIRDQLQKSNVFQKVLAENWTELQERHIADVCLAITNSGAASFLVAHLKKFSEPRDLTAKFLKHAARFLPAEQFDSLAAFAREKFSSDIDLQLALFTSIQDGAAQRGMTLTGVTRDWATELASKLLALDNAAAWINTPLDGATDARSPWAFQERVCADGEKAQLMSSHPNGEPLTGVLRSAPFKLPAKLQFYLAGHDGAPGKPPQKKNVLRLRDADSNALLREAWPPRNDRAQRVSWDLAAFNGKRGYIEVTDADTAGAYAWLAFGRFEPALPELALGNVSASRQQVAADICRTLRLTNFEQPLLRLTTNRIAGVDARASAARAVASFNAVPAVDALASVLNDGREPLLLREKFASALGEMPGGTSGTALVGAFKTASARLQSVLANALAANTANAELLLVAAADGRVPARLLQERALRDKLAAAKVPDFATRLAKLTKDLPAADDARLKLLEQRRKDFARAQASAERGAAVFEKNCAACHQIDGKGALVGPQLDGVGARGVERIIEDVLDPNRNVDTAFRATLFELNDGDMVSGLFRREEGELVIYAESTGKEQSLPKKNIKGRRQSELSLMPDNFADLIPANEFNDLMAFLLAKTATKK